MDQKISIVFKMDIFIKTIRNQLRARCVMAKKISLFFSYPINLGERQRPSENAAAGSGILKKLWRHQ